MFKGPIMLQSVWIRSVGPSWDNLCYGGTCVAGPGVILTRWKKQSLWGHLGTAMVSGILILTALAASIIFRSKVTI